MKDVTLDEFAEMCLHHTCPICPMWQGAENVPDHCCPVNVTGMTASEASVIVRQWQKSRAGKQD